MGRRPQVSRRYSLFLLNASIKRLQGFVWNLHKILKNVQLSFYCSNTMFSKFCLVHSTFTLLLQYIVCKVFCGTYFPKEVQLSLYCFNTMFARFLCGKYLQGFVWTVWFICMFPKNVQLSFKILHPNLMQNLPKMWQISTAHGRII